MLSVCNYTLVTRTNIDIFIDVWANIPLNFLLIPVTSNNIQAMDKYRISKKNQGLPENETGQLQVQVWFGWLGWLCFMAFQSLLVVNDKCCLYIYLIYDL